MGEVAGHRAELRISFDSQVQHHSLQIHVYLKHTTRRAVHALHTGIQMGTHACAYFTIQTHMHTHSHIPHTGPHVDAYITQRHTCTPLHRCTTCTHTETHTDNHSHIACAGVCISTYVTHRYHTRTHIGIRMGTHTLTCTLTEMTQIDVCEHVQPH